MKLLDLFLPINRTICPVVALFAAFLACGNPAHAQSNVVINCQTGTTSTGAPIYAPASTTNPCPVLASGSPTTPGYVLPGQVTPTALLNSAIAVGTTAVNATTGAINGCYIKNPLTAAGQGIATAENLFISVVTAATTTEGNTITAIEPGGTFTCAPGQTTTTSVNAATTAHKFEGAKW